MNYKLDNYLATQVKVTRTYLLTVHTYEGESYDVDLVSSDCWLDCLTGMLKWWIDATYYYENNELISHLNLLVDDEEFLIPYQLMDEVISRIAISYCFA